MQLGWMSGPLSFIKSPYVLQLPVGDPPAARDHDDAGSLHQHPPGIQKPLNVSKKGDRVARTRDVRNRHLCCRRPRVSVMQTANSLLCPERANYIRLRFHRPSARRLLIQSEMSSVVVIIAYIFEAEPNPMSLIQRDHVIQHLAKPLIL